MLDEEDRMCYGQQSYVTYQEGWPSPYEHHGNHRMPPRRYDQPSQISIHNMMYHGSHAAYQQDGFHHGKKKYQNGHGYGGQGQGHGQVYGKHGHGHGHGQQYNHGLNSGPIAYNQAPVRQPPTLYVMNTPNHAHGHVRFNHHGVNARYENYHKPQHGPSKMKVQPEDDSDDSDSYESDDDEPHSGGIKSNYHKVDAGYDNYHQYQHGSSKMKPSLVDGYDHSGSYESDDDDKPDFNKDAYWEERGLP